MEKEVFKINPEWNRIVTRHQDKCQGIQLVVDNLVNNGLNVTTGDLKDLISNGTALHDQIDQVVKSNAGIFKLPHARKQFIDQNTDALRELAAASKRNIFELLAIESQRPLSIDAYEISNGEVVVSERWIEEFKENHTLRLTESRQKALELIRNVEAAINELNAFVLDNKYFGAGISTESDSRRCLMYIRHDASVHICENEFEFI